MPKVPHDPNEVISVVDDEDNVIGKAIRKDVHLNGLLHRESYIYLINSKKQVLLHKRADFQLWDHSSSGHFPSEQNYQEAALREFEEELGIKLDQNDIKKIAKERLNHASHGKINNRFVTVFLVKKDIPLNVFNIDKGEIAEIKYFNKKELNELLSNTTKITDSAKYLIEKYIMKFLQ